MKPRHKVLILALAVVGSIGANSASAQMIDYLTNTTAGTTNGWAATVQTFTSSIDQTLTSYAFVGGVSEQGDFSFRLYDWTGLGSSPALFSTTQSWVGGTNLINGINVALQSGHVYAAEVDYLGGTSGGVAFGNDVYSGGMGFWAYTPGIRTEFEGFADLDTAFRVSFSTSGVPESSAVPEPQTYALLGGLVTLAAIIVRRRRA